MPSFLPPIGFWLYISAACVAIGMVWGLYRKGVIPMFRRSRRTWKRVDLVIDGLLGKPAVPATDTEPEKPAVISLFDRFSEMEDRLERVEKLAEDNVQAIKAHVEWHPNPGGRPASGRRNRTTNGVEGKR